MKIYLFAILAIIVVAAGVSALEDFLSPQASYQQSTKTFDHAAAPTTALASNLAVNLTAQSQR